MAQSDAMIEPFEAVSRCATSTISRVISYGTSSYGYDVRCAR
jgi:dCTP deaminase